VKSIITGFYEKSDDVILNVVATSGRRGFLQLLHSMVSYSLLAKVVGIAPVDVFKAS